MTTIPGYTLTAPVCETGDLLLYRAARSRDGAPVLLKIPASAHPTPLLLTRLEREYELARALDSSRIAHPIALERQSGSAVLVLEPGPTRTLASMLGSPMDIQSFLQVAIGINAALAEMHHHELVHKDLKPENVLLDVAGHVWLTGLGIATRRPRERQTPEPPEVIAGTLAYMAPEQTGRMNRSIDSRSDLYALGATFYQMLTGVLPFTASDAMEWVHCHIARQPIPPSQRVPGIPAPLSAMVMKLLAKTAEERYRSTRGLDADLRHCLAEWESNGRVDSFPPGELDVPDRLLIPEKLYGRKSEIDALLATFDEVVTSGTPALVLISGYSGIGKTSVVDELHKALVPPRGLFAAGKFEQYTRDIPYATLVQALKTLIRQILARGEADVTAWRDSLQKAVSPNGQLIVGLIPDVEFIIGKQPPVPELPPQEAQNRFQMVLQHLIGVFARSEHPLVLFLDDLQWLDAATLQLVEQLVSGQEVHHLLLIGAYRDNEVGSTHPLMRLIEAMRRREVGLHEIVLAPLAIDDVGSLVADALHSDRASALPLARLVHEKTGGNPFFVIQFLKALAEERLIAFDVGAGRWTWDLARIHAKGYTDNVVDLMIGRLGRLPTATLAVLRQFACLGNVSGTATLSMVSGQSEEALHASLWEAERAGLVSHLRDGYAFLHDRIHEAAYALTPESERPALHVRIGRLMASTSSKEDVEKRVFDVVNQLNLGSSLITDPDERCRTAELNLIAGKKAKASAAYASAARYFAAGSTLLQVSGWQAHSELTYELHFQLAECEYLSGQLDVAEQRLSLLLSRAKTAVEKANVCRLQIALHTTRGDMEQAIERGLEGLRLFGLELPSRPTDEQVRQEYAGVWEALGRREISDLMNQSLVQDSEAKAVMGLLAELGTPAIFVRQNLLHLTLARMVRLSIEDGLTSASVWAFVWFGATLVQRNFAQFQAGYRFGKLAYDLMERHAFHGYRPKVCLTFGDNINFYVHHLKTDRDLINLAFQSAVENGDLVWACYSCNHIISNMLSAGDPLEETWDESVRRLEFVRKAKDPNIEDILISQQRFILNLRGLTEHDGTFSGGQFNENEFEIRIRDSQMQLIVCWYFILKLQARFIFGDIDAALAAAETAGRLILTSGPDIQGVDYDFFAALAKVERRESAPPEQRGAYSAEISGHLKLLRDWAESCPENFLNRYALVSAEVARISGQELEAEQWYEKAIQSADGNGFFHNGALACELTARFFRARGLGLAADAYLRQAHAGYARWGAQGKVRQLERRYPQLRGERPPLAPLAPIGTFATGVQALDILAVVRASQAISGEIVLDNLLKTLMRTVLESAGARRGYLLLIRDGVLSLAADARVENQNVVVRARKELDLSEAMLPASILDSVSRSRGRVLLDDAASPNPYASDQYFSSQHPRSVLCFPIVKQTRLIGVLYLENDLATHAFTPDRQVVLELLAAQVAISLENALVYEALQEGESKYRRIVDTANEGIWVLGPGHSSPPSSTPGWPRCLGVRPKR